MSTYYIIKFNTNGQFISGSYLGKSGNAARTYYGMNLYTQGIYFYGSDEGPHNVATSGAFQDTPLEGKPNSFLSKYADESLGTENYDHLAIAIYPNPTSSVLNFGFIGVDNSPIEIEVYNILGQFIKAESTSDSKGFIDLDNLSSGVYLLRFRAKNSGKFTTKKIIIK